MTSLLYVVVIESRPMELLEGPLWLQDESISPAELFLRRNPDVLSQRSLHQNMYNPGNALWKSISQSDVLARYRTMNFDTSGVGGGRRSFKKESKFIKVGASDRIGC